MRKALSLDLRERIVAAYESGEGTGAEVARRFRVSVGLVNKLLRQHRRTGDLRPRYYRCGAKPRITAAHQQQMRQLLARKPDLLLRELRDALGLNCTVQAIHYALARMGLTYKKRRSAPANRIEPTSPERGDAGAASNPALIRRV